MWTHEFLENIARERELTEEQKAVFLAKLLGDTRSDIQIGEELHISPDAVRNRLSGIYQKFGIEGKGTGKYGRLLDLLAREQEKFKAPCAEISDNSSKVTISKPDPNFLGRESVIAESHPDERNVDSKLENQVIQAQIERILEDKANISREKLFGVEEYIATLRDYLQDKEGSWFISIVGSGGVGKTSVVEKLVREHTVESGFVELAWVTAKRSYFLVENLSIRDVETALNIDALISDIAGQLKIKLPPTVDEHFSCLQNYLKSKPCLIVIDNLETLQDYTDLIKKFNSNSQKNNLRPSKLLFTSRQKIQKLTTQVREVELKGIGVNPTLELIRYKGAHVQRINDALDEELLPIFRATNGVPLIILLVVSLVATDDSPLDEIIQSLSRQEELYTYLYEEALVSIKENALKVLTSMTRFSESSPVPRRLLKQETQLNDDDFREAVGECIQRSLLTSISKLSEEPRYSIHNLLYEFLRSELFSDEA